MDDTQPIGAAARARAGPVLALPSSAQERGAHSSLMPQTDSRLRGARTGPKSQSQALTDISLNPEPKFLSTRPGQGFKKERKRGLRAET